MVIESWSYYKTVLANGDLTTINGDLMVIFMV